MIHDQLGFSGNCNDSEVALLEQRTVAGLHDFLANQVLHRFSPTGGPAVDLGAGSGALAVRLRSLGWNVQAADMDAPKYKANVPFVQLNLDQPDFATQLGEGRFDLVTAVEVIEHVESPIGFLRNVGRLLKSTGLAVLTTPNVDNAPARLKFLLSGVIRMMDQNGDKTHISPIFWDLFRRQYLPRAGLTLVERHVYPPNGYKVTRPQYAWAARALGWLLVGECLEGDNHILVLRAQR
jgi:SAM-dependent methyltransferase